jgi:hypothetical protein
MREGASALQRPHKKDRNDEPVGPSGDGNLHVLRWLALHGGAQNREGPALEYLIYEGKYNSALWLLEEYGILPDTNAVLLLMVHLSRKPHFAVKEEQWRQVMQTLLDKTTSLPKDCPYLLQYALSSGFKDAHILAQIIGKGADPDICAIDGRDALTYLRDPGVARTMSAGEKAALEAVLLAEMQSRRPAPKPKAHQIVLEDVSDARPAAPSALGCVPHEGWSPPCRGSSRRSSSSATSNGT